MLRKGDVTNVIVQADYMSGDRNTIASALRVNDQLGVLVLTGRGHDAAGSELYNFYKAAAGDRRVYLHTVDVPNGSTPEVATGKVRQAYKSVTANTPRARAKANPWVKNCVEDGVGLRSATYGTQVIKEAFSAGSGTMRDKLRDYWRLSSNTGGKDLRKEVDGWLKKRGFDEKRSYIFLFAKEGDRTAEKAHHFTSILTWRTLQERIGRETSVVPVATGDDIGLRTNPSMVKFWKDSDWKDIFKDTGIDSRTAQLGMWCHLAENYKVSMMGMRSGMLEVPALLGIRTLYLEENHNQQAERMAKWLDGVVPGWERLKVNVPPGIKQQIYWKQAAQALDKRPKPLDPNGQKVVDHANALGGHVQGLVLGFKRTGSSLAARQSGTLDVQGGRREIAKRVFGPGGLAPTVPARKFMLQDAEFNCIVDWAKGGKIQQPTLPPKQKPGASPGQIQRRGVSMTRQPGRSGGLSI